VTETAWSPAAVETGRSSVLQELRKIPAFVRRDFLVAWSYRMAFASDAVGLVAGAALFYLIGLMIDPAKIPSFGGTRATYMEFVAVGLALGVFIQLGLARVANALRNEQLTGTLECLLMTPTAPATIQLGSVAYDLLYIPLRTGIFLLIVAFAFGLDLDIGGALPAALALLLFIPFVWGIGVATAASMLTFRRGTGVLGLGVAALSLASGAYVPLQLLPSWIEKLAGANPMALALDAMREGLLGDASVGDVAPKLLVLAPMSAGSLGLGLYLFGLAMRREQRRGSIGLY